MIWLRKRHLLVVFNALIFKGSKRVLVWRFRTILKKLHYFNFAQISSMLESNSKTRVEKKKYNEDI